MQISHFVGQTGRGVNPAPNTALLFVCTYMVPEYQLNIMFMFMFGYRECKL